MPDGFQVGEDDVVVLILTQMLKQKAVDEKENKRNREK